MSGLDKRVCMITLRSDVCMGGSRPKWETFFTAKLQGPPRRARTGSARGLTALKTERCDGRTG